MLTSAELHDLPAYHLASQAHEGQLRKYTGEPYIVHPLAVATMINEAGLHVDAIQAALLHDVLEDTDTTPDDLLYAGFCDRVIRWVVQLTDPPKDDYRTYGEGANRATRKRICRTRLGNADPDAMSIKLADLIHNTPSIVGHDPEFAKTYLREKESLLDVLGKGNPRLYTRARHLLVESMGKLSMP